MKQILLIGLLMTLLPAALPAQGPSPNPFRHRLIVKVRQGYAATDALRLLATAQAPFGITSARPWINPKLLAYDPRGEGPAAFRKTSRDTGAIASSMENLSRIVLIQYSSPDDPRIVAAAVGSLPGVEYAESVYGRYLLYTPNDPELPRQGYLEQIHATAAWDVARADPSVVIAIADVGIAFGHPDLQGALWTNAGEIGKDANGRDKRTNGIDDDGNGFVDDVVGYDFGGRDGFTPDNDPSPRHWHATHVAGIAAGIGDNGAGIAGVGFGARLMTLKISDDDPNVPGLTGGFEAILYGAKMGARIVNCSWGGGGFSKAEQEVVNAATALGSLVVAAAGNEGFSASLYPASYQNVLSIASVSGSDKRSLFSNFNDAVGISAPGEDAYSTLPAFFTPSGYGTSSGTSMSAPMVSGAAALIFAKYPLLRPDQVAAVLRATADNIDAANPDYLRLLGSGRLNVQRAVTSGPTAGYAHLVNVTYTDDSGDGIIDANEGVQMEISVKNLLRPVTGLIVTVSSPASIPPIFTNSRSYFGTMSTDQTLSNASDRFRFVTPPDLPLDYDLPLVVTMRDTNNVVIGAERISVPVRPSFATTAFNRITATFTGNGRIGFADGPNNTRGRGFHLDTADNVLAEGGALIGISPDRLADVVRGATFDFPQNTGLQTVEPYRVRYSASDNAEIGTARLNDAHLLDQQRIGVDVRLTTYAYKGNNSVNNQLLLLYRITNTTSGTLENLHFALFFDWDIGPKGLDNLTMFNETHRLGYTYNVKTGGLPFAGVMLVSDQPMDFAALDNAAAPLASGFLQIEKWQTISGGILREQSEVGDCSMIIGAGPITLAAGADTVVAFSVIAGNNLAELQASAIAARGLFALNGGIPGGPLVLPHDLGLSVTGLNPFRDRTQVTFTLPERADVTLDIYNAIGQRLATLAAGSYPRGRYTVPVDAAALRDHGLLFVRLDALGRTLMTKLVKF